MSRDTDIYVSNHGSQDELMQAIGRTLGEDFIHEEGGEAYIRIDPIAVYFGQHDLPDDPLDIPGGDGIRLTRDYPNWIEVVDTEKNLPRQEAVANKIFDALKATRKWRLVLIDDMQKVVDRYEPEDGSAVSES